MMERGWVGWLLAFFAIVACSRESSQPLERGSSAGAVATTPAAGSSAPASPHQRFALASMCGYPFAFDLKSCQGLAQWSECAWSECDLVACEQVCASLVACIEADDDPCSARCQRTTKCQDCMSVAVGCTARSCLRSLRCTTTTPGGTCDQMKTCCSTAPELDDQNLCLMTIDLIGMLNGDEGCFAGSKDVTVGDVYPEVAECIDMVLGPR
jgi:hypothetical protein